MKPACATEEYASIRLTSVWVTAVTVPTTIVRIATTHSTGRHPWLQRGQRDVEHAQQRAERGDLGGRRHERR